MYEWHKLLTILERTVCVVNSPNRVYAQCLYEKIGSQLSEFPVRVIMPKPKVEEKHESRWRRFWRRRRHVIY